MTEAHNQGIQLTEKRSRSRFRGNVRSTAADPIRYAVRTKPERTTPFPMSAINYDEYYVVLYAERGGGLK